VYLRELREKHLQTVIPKVGERVLILSGSHRGEKGRVMQREKNKERVVVQTEEEL
jgi:ribosomal protein L24